MFELIYRFVNPGNNMVINAVKFNVNEFTSVDFLSDYGRLYGRYIGNLVDNKLNGIGYYVEYDDNGEIVYDFRGEFNDNFFSKGKMCKYENNSVTIVLDGFFNKDGQVFSCE